MKGGKPDMKLIKVVKWKSLDDKKSWLKDPHDHEYALVIDNVYVLF